MVHTFSFQICVCLFVLGLYVYPCSCCSGFCSHGGFKVFSVRMVSYYKVIFRKGCGPGHLLMDFTTILSRSGVDSNLGG